MEVGTEILSKLQVNSSAMVIVLNPIYMEKVPLRKKCSLPEVRIHSPRQNYTEIDLLDEMTSTTRSGGKIVDFGGH